MYMYFIRRKVKHNVWKINNSKNEKLKHTDLVPLSIAFDKAPVWRDKWKLKSKLCKCKNTLLATLLIESWATLANTAFRSSLNKEAPALAVPSKKEKKIKVFLKT